MKKILGTYILWFFLTIFLITWCTFANLSTKILLIEKTVAVESHDIYQQIYYDELIAWLESVCDTNSIDLANGYVDQLRVSLQLSYDKLPIHLQLSSSEKLHNRLAVYNNGAKIPENIMCSLKLILYKLQSWLKDYHNDLLVQEWLQNDFQTTNGEEIVAQDLKYEMLDWQIEQLLPYEALFDSTFQFNEWINTNAFRPDLIELSQKSKRIMELSVKKWFYELMQAGLLDESDVFILNEKITLHTNLSCDTLNGNYTITQKTNKLHEHVRYSKQEMPLWVNVCGNYFFIKELSDHFYKIVLHEMWHHFYYHHDREWSSDFINICREDDTCDVQDFVSAYATTSPEEDYAEHFMFRFLWRIDGDTQILDEKSLHFDNFLKN